MSARNIIKQIFGRTFSFNSYGEYGPYLEESLLLYPSGCANDVSVVVNFVEQSFPDNVVANNPKIYEKIVDGFQANFGPAMVAWRKITNSPLQVDVHVRDLNYSGPVGFVRKLRSMEFSRGVEWFVQVLHELVLVPTSYFFPELATMHAASIGYDGGCILLTGTGGVGKSSAMIAVAGMDGFSFISDDIAIVSDSGLVYGNMAWPKIYGYNCVANDMKSRVLKNRGIFDVAHFWLKNKIDPSSVRRKIKPNALFQNWHAGGNSLSNICFLFRTNVSDFELDVVSRETAVDMACHVMLAEYQVFHKYINWEEYNSQAAGLVPVLRMADILKKWRGIYKNIFPDQVYVLRIPMNVAHAAYNKQIVKLITGFAKE